MVLLETTWEGPSILPRPPFDVGYFAAGTLAERSAGASIPALIPRPPIRTGGSRRAGKPDSWLNRQRANRGVPPSPCKETFGARGKPKTAEIRSGA